MGAVRIGLAALGAALAVLLLAGPQSVSLRSGADHPIAVETPQAAEASLTYRVKLAPVTKLRAEARPGEFLIKTDTHDYLAFRRPRVETSTGTYLVGDKVEPWQVNGVVRYNYPTWYEEYTQANRSFQQVLWFRGPLSGDVRVRIPFETNLAVERMTPRALAFVRNNRAQLGYRDAFAMDAAGRVLPLDVAADGGEIVMAIPEEWIEEATWPVLVDPLVFAPASSLTGDTPSRYDWEHPNLAVAYNPDNNRYFVAWYDITDRGTVTFAAASQCSTPVPAVLGELVDVIMSSQMWGRGIYLFREYPPGDGYYTIDDPPIGALLNAPFQIAGQGLAGPPVVVSPSIVYRSSANAGDRRFMIAWSGGDPPPNDANGYRNDAAGALVTVANSFGTNWWSQQDHVHPPVPVCDPVLWRTQDFFPANSHTFAQFYSATAQATTDALLPALRVVDPNVPAAPTNPPPQRSPYRKPRASWDGTRFVVMSERNEPGANGINLDYADPDASFAAIGKHVWVYSIWWRLFGVTFTALDPMMGTVLLRSELTANKPRIFFGKSGVEWIAIGPDYGNVLKNMVQTETVSGVVPMDSDPDIASLAGVATPGVAWGAPPSGWTGAWPPLPGLGSVGVYTLTSVLFEVPKSRIRGYYIPTGGAPIFTWEVYNPVPDDPNSFPWQGDTILTAADVPSFVARPRIAARTDDRPGYLVTYQSIELGLELATPGFPMEELAGGIYYRSVFRTGRNASPPSLAVAGGEPVNGVNNWHLWPQVSWSNRKRQFFLSWTATDDVMWNPRTMGMGYVSRADLFLDPTITTSPLASLYAAPMSAFDDEVRMAVVRSDQIVEIPRNLVGKVPQENMGIVTPGVDFVSPTGANPADQNIYVINASGTGSDLPWRLETITYHNATAGWLAASATSGLLPRSFSDPTRQPTGYPAWWQTVALSANPAGLPAGVYQATALFSLDPALENNPRARKVRMPVTFTVLSPTTPGIYVSPAVLGFLAGKDDPNPGSQQVLVDNRGSSGSTLSWTATLDYGGGPTGWLTVSPTNGQVFQGFPETMTVSLNKSVLPDPTPGSGDTLYNATIRITSGNAVPSTFDIPVIFTYRDQPVYDTLITLLEDDSSDSYCQRYLYQEPPVVADPRLVTTPNKLLFQWDPPNASSLPLPSQTANIENKPPDGTDVLSVLTWTAEAQNSWISITPTTGKHRAGDPPNTITVSVDPTGFPVGVFDGSILITASEGQTTTIAVQLIVGKVGGISLQPLVGELDWTRYFNVPKYSPPPAPSSSQSTAQSMSVADQQSLDLQFALQDFNWSPGNTGHWLARGMPGWLQLETFDDITGQWIKLNTVPDSYDPEADNWAQANSATQPGVRKYESTPPTQLRKLRFRTDHTGILWGGPPLPAGTYNSTVKLEADVPGIQLAELVVQVTVNPEPIAVPVIGATPAWLPFQVEQGSPNPPPSTLTITNNSPGTLLKCKYTLIGANVTWLALNPAPGTVLDTDTTDEDSQPGNDSGDGLVNGEPIAISVMVNATALTPGTYEAEIKIDDVTNFGNSKSVPIVLIVEPAASTLTVSPASLTFNMMKGDANPAPQDLTISNGGSTYSMLSYTINFQPQSWWLSVDGSNSGSPTGAVPGGTSKTVPIAVDAAAMNAGSYTGTLTIEDPNATGSPVSVAVNLVIDPPSSDGTLDVTPTSLTFSAIQGGTNPANQRLTIKNTAAASKQVNFTLSADQPWVIFTPTTGGPIMGGGSQDAFITVSATSLSVGTYTANVTVSAPGASGSPKTVSVTVNVSATAVASGSARSTRGGGKKGGGCSAVAPEPSHLPAGLLGLACILLWTARASLRRGHSLGGLR